MEYKISIVVDGKDNASAPLRGVGNALANMSQIAGGILGAGLITGIAQRLQGLAMQAITATASLQQMQVGMEGLLAREIANTSQLEALAAAEKGIAQNAMSIAEAMPIAQERAKGLMDELARIAILSPYQFQTVQQTYQTALAFGYSSEEAKGYTQAILNMAAGVGANNEMLGRMSYNFSQIRMQGRVTALDIRQLAMAGFDLTSVLKYAGEQFGVTIKDHSDFNEAIASGKLTWKQFTEAFQKYAEENFGGASERMSRTLMGLQSTFQDIMVLTLPSMLGPAVEKITGFLNTILDSILKFRESGLLEKWGQSLGAVMDDVVKAITPIAEFIDLFFSEMAKGISPLDSLKIAILDTFGVQALFTFNDALAQLSEVWDNITGAVESAKKALLPLLQQAGKWVQENIVPYISLKDILIALGIALAVTVVPALLSLVGAILSAAAPIAILLGAIVLLRNAWESNWMGIRDAVTQAWGEHIYPAIQQLWAWLQVNLPIAIRALSDFWNNTLLPAIQAVWNWVQTTAIPIIQDLWAWLQVNLPIAIQALSDFWNNTLLPAVQIVVAWFRDNLLPILKEIWDVVINYIVPYFRALVDFWNAELTLAITALQGLWKNVLQPALEGIWEFIDANLLPIFVKIGDYLKKTLGPIIEEEKKKRFDKLIETFANIKNAIKWAKDMLEDLAEALRNVKLPKWLTPGSPTPFEMGLRGINRELKALAYNALPQFSAGISFSRKSGNANPAPSLTIGNVTIQAAPGQNGEDLWREIRDAIRREQRQLGRAGAFYQGV